MTAEGKKHEYTGKGMIPYTITDGPHYIDGNDRVQPCRRSGDDRRVIASPNKDYDRPATKKCPDCTILVWPDKLRELNMCDYHNRRNGKDRRKHE